MPPRDVLAALDRQTLDAAISGSRSWRQVLLRLGLKSHRHVRALRELCEAWGVPFAHLVHQAPPDEALRSVLAAATSWTDALTRLGFAEESGSARSTIRKHAARLGLDVGHLDDRLPAPTAQLSMQPDLAALRFAGTYLAAGAFVLAGHRVCWPLEPAPYDLIVEAGGTLLRVQVKTSSRLVAGSWVCAITRSEYADVAGGKRRVCYTPEDVDLFAILDGDGQMYVIPIEDVTGMTALSLRRYAKYRVPRTLDGAGCRGDRIRTCDLVAPSHAP